MIGNRILQCFKTGQIRNMDRYREARRVLEENPQVNKLYGHSMGGSVVLELNNEFPDRKPMELVHTTHLLYP